MFKYFTGIRSLAAKEKTGWLKYRICLTRLEHLESKRVFLGSLNQNIAAYL